MKDFLKNINRIIRRHKYLLTLSLVALLAVSGICVRQSLAYFTTYATAKGQMTIQLGHESKIKEGFKDWQKDIQIENTGEVDEFVRCKIICASQFEISASGDNWSQGDDGYWYYSKVVKVNETTDSLLAYIKVSEDVESSFNIVVIQECIPVTYDSQGNASAAKDADWTVSAKYNVEEADE